MTRQEAPTTERLKEQSAVLEDLKERAKSPDDEDRLYFSGPEIIGMADLFGINVSNELRMILGYPESSTDFDAETLTQMKSAGELRDEIQGRVILFEVLKEG